MVVKNKDGRVVSLQQLERERVQALKRQRDALLAACEAAVCYWIRLESIGAVNKHERMGLMLRADEWRTAELEAVEELWK